VRTLQVPVYWLAISLAAFRALGELGHGTLQLGENAASRACAAQQALNVDAQRVRQ
jgi:hypothetical protein